MRRDGAGLRPDNPPAHVLRKVGGQRDCARDAPRQAEVLDRGTGATDSAPARARPHTVMSSDSSDTRPVQRKDAAALDDYEAVADVAAFGQDDHLLTVLDSDLRPHVEPR